MRALRKVGLACICLLVVAAAPRPASACGRSPCNADQFVPASAVSRPGASASTGLAALAVLAALAGMFAWRTRRRRSAIGGGVVVAAAAVVLGLAVGVPRARACSGPPCATDQFVPVSGTLPSNAPAIAVFLGGDSRGGTYIQSAAKNIALSCRGGSGAGALVPFELRVGDMACGGPQCAGALSLIVPQSALSVGHTCVIAGTDCDRQWAGHEPLAGSEYLEGRAEFVVTEAADLPATLGTIALSEPEWEDVELAGGAGCKYMAPSCVVRAELTLSEDATPWRDALMYETWALGTPEQYGGSYLGRGKEILFYRQTGPAGPYELTRGNHSVVMRATLPGSDVVVESEALELQLDCDNPSPADGGTHHGADGGKVTGRTAEESASGTCAVVPGQPRATTPLAGLFALAGFAFVRLARRRSRIA